MSILTPAVAMRHWCLVSLALTAVLQLQLTRSEYEQVTVMLKSWEDIERNFSLSLVTELEVETSEEIKLKLVDSATSCALTQIANNSYLTVAINNDSPRILPYTRTVDITTGLSSINQGQLNKILIQTVTNYKLNSTTRGICWHKTYPLFTTRFSHYFHLYVFDAPVLDLGNDSRTLVCRLQNGMEEYTDFFVSFIREYVDTENRRRNVTVGRCSSTDHYPLEHHGMSIYYDKANNSIVMKLPDTIDQQHDTGTYYCDMQIRNAERNELIMHGKGMITIDPDHPTIGPVPNPPTGSPNVAAAIAIPVVAGIALVIVVAAVAIVRLIKKCRQYRGYQPVDGQNDPHQPQQHDGSNARRRRQRSQQRSVSSRPQGRELTLPIDPDGATPSTICGTPGPDNLPFDEQDRIGSLRSGSINSAASESDGSSIFSSLQYSTANTNNPGEDITDQPLSLDSAPSTSSHSSINSHRSLSGDN